MPFKYEPYQSTYVDPQSVKISETLRNRFMENLQANDALAMSLDQMQAALPFENDVQKKRELQKEIDETLTQMAEQGNYEDLGFKIRAAAKTFTKKYTPIKENYDRYQAALTDLDKRYKAKEIDAEVYARAGSYMTRGYKGFEIDPETGRVKEGTMFSAPTIYNDPNITDKIIKALSIIKPDKYQNKSNRLGVGPNGEYIVTNESGVEQVPPEDIEAAFNYVMAMPDVALAVQQKADMRAYDLHKAGNIPTAINQTITQYNDLISKYTTEMNTKSMSKAQKAQYQKAINAMKSEINKATEASKDETTAYNYVKSRIEQEIVSPAKDWAMLAAYKHTASSTIYEYDPIYKSRLESAMKEAEAAMPIYAQTEAKAIENGGATVAEKQQTIERLRARNADIDKELTSTLDKTAKERLEQEKRNNLARISSQEYQIQKAREAGASRITVADLENFDKDIVAVMRAMMPNATPAQLVSQMQRTFDNTGDQDYMDFEKQFNNTFGSGALNNHLNNKYNIPATQKMLEGRVGARTEPGAPQLLDMLNYQFKLEDNTQAALNEMKVSQVFNYGTIQAGSPKESIQLTKALDDFLVGKPINSVAIPTAYDISAGQKVDDTSVLSGYIVNDYGFDSSTNTFELVLYNKDAPANKWKKVHVSGDYLSANIPLLNMVNEPTAKLANIVLMEKPIGGTPDNPEIYSRPIFINKQVTDAVTGAVTIVEVPGFLSMRSIGYGTPTVSLSLQDGSPIFIDKDGDPSTNFRDIEDPELKSVIETGLIKL